MATEKRYHLVAFGEVVMKTNVAKAALGLAKRYAKEMETTVTIDERISVVRIDEHGNQRGELT